MFSCGRSFIPQCSPSFCACCYLVWPRECKQLAVDMRHTLICSSFLQANYYDVKVSRDDKEYGFDDESKAGNTARVVTFRTGLLVPLQGNSNLPCHMAGSYSWLVCRPPVMCSFCSIFWRIVV